MNKIKKNELMKLIDTYKDFTDYQTHEVTIKMIFDEDLEKGYISDITKGILNVETQEFKVLTDLTVDNIIEAVLRDMSVTGYTENIKDYLITYKVFTIGNRVYIDRR